MEQAQRTDITKVVEDLSKTRAEAPGPPRKAPAPKPKKRPTKKLPATSKPWYLVIDEIVEGTVTFEAWPWPDVDPATRFLKFDLNQTKNKTVDLVDLQKRVNALRTETEKDTEAASRPLRIGDVFEVEATNIEKLNGWRRVVDDTYQKRREARAALHAMAAPVLDPETASELEKLARESKLQPDDTDVIQTFGATASPAV
jgi:hypothetical protein